MYRVYITSQPQKCHECTTQEKTCVYNLTVYEGADGNAYCFSWNYTTKIGSALLEWINTPPENASRVSVFSDICSGQNRNQCVVAALLHAVKSSRNIKIWDTRSWSVILCTQHLNNKSVHCMSAWLEILKNARSKNPYHVKEFSYQYFFDLNYLAAILIRNRNLDEHGHEENWLKIKSLRFEKKQPSTIFYRYIKIAVDQGKGRPRKSAELRQMYSALIPISDMKKRDLLRLCTSKAIPE
ncbi:hypothetical protein PR048_007120 [Dryococelus australis]|uniref:Uncharacterized protein n=1 Tax=Dryococelus australis TaxID=614101 RepID=A0ABQ9ICV3_9NEOP|nr:hypothetical protein PR048_007120 [Dryococelus australis]